LFLEGGSSVKSINFLRKPTHVPLRERAQRPLAPDLAPVAEPPVAGGGGVDAFREMLALYDLPRSPRRSARSAASRHRTAPASAWLAGNPFTCLVRGVEVRLGIDEEAFVGSGIHAFAHIIERFLALYVHANSFTQLVIVSQKTGEELFECLPRSGDLSLL
jgi:type VI secretion system protein ImpG